MSEKDKDIIKNDGIGIYPTDTLYGVVGSALSPKAIERIYAVKGRDPKKPLIILISDFSDLALFNVVVSNERKEKLESYWPGPFSIILPIVDVEKKLEHLHRGTCTLAFRLPNDPWLQEILRDTGPLVAPSANPEGLPPAKTIEEARNYFDNLVDFYHDGGVRDGKASQLISLVEGEAKVIRA